METLKYTLLMASTILFAQGLAAETDAQKLQRAHATKTKKHEAKKHETKKEAKKHEKYTKKAAAKQNVTKINGIHKSLTTKTTKAATPHVAAKKSSWFGSGARTAAASKAAGIHHRGPSGFLDRHKFPAGWNRGFTGYQAANGEWLFGGYPLIWWYENEPTYYRDVVRPEATKAGVPVLRHEAIHNAKGKIKG
jgi:hypothetical protein